MLTINLHILSVGSLRYKMVTEPPSGGSSTELHKKSKILGIFFTAFVIILIVIVTTVSISSLKIILSFKTRQNAALVRKCVFFSLPPQKSICLSQFHFTFKVLFCSSKSNKKQL